MKPRNDGDQNRKLSIVLIIFMLVSGLLSSCTKPVPISIELDTTPVLSGGLGWAVVSGAFARLKTDPSFEAGDGDYARRGDILPVVGIDRSFQGRDRGTWYRLEGNEASGWLHESLMDVYPSLERAKNAAGSATKSAQEPTR